MMQRFGGLLRTAARGTLLEVDGRLSAQSMIAARAFNASLPQQSDPIKKDDALPEGKKDEFDHATGLEKAELDGLARGENIFEEAWITAKFGGTPEDPVVVESVNKERIIGVPDPEDDCLIVWDTIKADEPPRQIIPGGEYFILKTIEAPSWTHIPESFKGESH